MPALVLITGGAGFLGSHLADRLLEAGYSVRILDNLDPQVHPRGRPAYLHPGAEFHQASVLDSAAVERALEDVAMVVHFAAVVGVGQSMYQIARYHEVNVQGTAVLLEAMLRRQREPRGGFRRLLLAGSMSIYGEGRYLCPGCGARPLVSPRPLAQLRRQQWEVACPECGRALDPLPTDETKPPQLGSYYALTKYLQESMCLLFGRTYGVSSVVLRFFNTYGPRQALSNPYTGVAAVFAGALLGGRAPQVFEDGGQLRSLVSVHDVTAACHRALEAEPAAIDGRAFNIASSQRLSVRELARGLAHTLGTALEPEITGRFRLGDARHCIASIAAAEHSLGYAPRVSLAAGLRELGEWLRGQTAHPSLQPRATEELLAYGLVG